MESSNKFLILIFLFFIFLFNPILSAELSINYPSESEKFFNNQVSPTYVIINMENYLEIKNEYLHISTSSSNKLISPLIISSTSQSHPSINSSDIYSTQRIGNALLFLGNDLLNRTIYLNITCNIYPCSFYLHLNLEENPILSPGQTFSYFVKNNKNNYTSYKIESQTALISNKIINKSSIHILTISISFSNINDVNTELFLNLKDTNNSIKLETNYNMEKRIIYAFKE